jgi:cation:H+ antiporter
VAIGLLLLFLLSVALALVASEVLVRGLDRLGVHLRLQEGLLGLLTALGADAPEVTSALLALRAGHADVGMGVVLGSNVFNLAALLGVGAIAAGHVRVRRIGLGLNGGVALLTTVFVGGLLTEIISPAITVFLVLLVFVPYLLVLALQPQQVSHLPLPGPLGRLLAVAVREISHEGHGNQPVATADDVTGHWSRPLVLILPALIVIVLASEGMVVSALHLATQWAIPSALVGAVVLASLTSLPNAYAALRFARQQRGSAVVSEAFNSNAINILAGICLPTLVLHGVASDAATQFDVLWLLGMTALTIVLLARRRGLNRPGGALIVGLYLLFVVLSLVR